MPVTFTTWLDKSVSATSHAESMGTDVTAIISVEVTPTTHANTVGFSSSRIVDLLRDTESHSSPLTTSTSRSETNYVNRTTESHSNSIITFAYNERTSLELLDYTVEWDDNEMVWYTPWVQEPTVLGREDRFVLRATTFDGAKDPCAKITIQYDKSGNGNIDDASEPVKIGHAERLHEVPDIPVDSSGYYRMKIDEYSGYNSLTSLDMGIVN